MSALARTALRLAGIEALKADATIAALCGARIYDSRIESLTETEPVPVIIVLTEEMEGDAWSANNGGPPFDDHCDLVLDIAMRAQVQAEDSEPFIGTPETNAELEAGLDLLEHCAVDALCTAATPQSLLLRRAVTRRVGKQKSVRYVEAETGIKLAERMVTLTVQLKGADQGIATEVGMPALAITANVGNHGNGAVTAWSPAATSGAIAGTYQASFTSAVEFVVDDPQGVAIGFGVVGRDFTSDVRFRIAAGSTPFQAGDGFAIVLSAGEFGALPEPLRTVALSLPSGAAKDLCRQIAAAMTPPAAPLFTGADATYAPQQQLDTAAPPVPPGQTGSHDTFGQTVTIPG